MQRNITELPIIKYSKLKSLTLLGYFIAQIVFLFFLNGKKLAVEKLKLYDLIVKGTNFISGKLECILLLVVSWYCI